MFDPDVRLSDGLAVFAEHWRSAFREHWGLSEDKAPAEADPQEWAYHKALSMLARQFVKAAKSLDDASGDHVALLKIFRDHIGDDLTQNEFMHQCIQLELAADVEDELLHRGRRTFELLAFLTTVRSERVRAYLQRVSECYVRGMPTETIVMCGAVLDVALQDAVPDQVVRSAKVRCGRHVSVGNRLEYLVQRGYLDQSTADAAFALVHERNKAVHAAPELTASLFDFVATLADLLRALPEPGSLTAE